MATVRAIPWRRKKSGEQLLAPRQTSEHRDSALALHTERRSPGPNLRRRCVHRAVITGGDPFSSHSQTLQLERLPALTTTPTRGWRKEGEYPRPGLIDERSRLRKTREFRGRPASSEEAAPRISRSSRSGHMEVMTGGAQAQRLEASYARGADAMRPPVGAIAPFRAARGEKSLGRKWRPRPTSRFPFFFYFRIFLIFFSLFIFLILSLNLPVNLYQF